MTLAPRPPRTSTDRPLRIGWASPINQASAIGRVSAYVTDALIARGHDVQLIATERKLEPKRLNHPTLARCIHWSKLDFNQLRDDTDIVVVNIGDHYEFHAGIFALLDHMNCLGIFHDFYIYNLFNGWLENTQVGRTSDWRRAKHDAEVTRAYGAPLAALAARARDGTASLETIAARMPMTEWLAGQCVGALAHANFYLDRLAAACPGPLATALLPVSGRGVAPLERRDGAKITVLTVGVMNRNKCAAEVIEAIAASPTLAARVAYRLVGPIEPAEAERLKGLAGARDYGGLTVFGSVDDQALKAHLEAADIICCLRRPVLEGASGSAVEGLLAGRPMIVADAGFYAELPDNVVFKIPADVDPARLTAHLERLCEHEPLRRTAGAKARAWAEARFNVAGYLAVLEPLMWATIAAEPLLAVSRRLGDEFAELGVGSHDPAVGRIDEALRELFFTADGPT